MKYEPKKVFVLEDGVYIELSYQEFYTRVQSSEGYSDKLFIPLHGMLMEVTEEDYREFYRSRRRQKYLKEQSEKNGDFSYDMLTADDFNGEDVLVDGAQDTEGSAIDRIMLDKLHNALSLLREDERLLIYRHFFEGKSQTELGRMYGLNQSNISRRIAAILQKLKEIL
ncbi:MAG: sigma-70 family RNA polymerase sigma factor [Butyrivibrio sp.]|nr:sigma-70 family RNA polymerase sigma factor [Butyrivibrio sp.]